MDDQPLAKCLNARGWVRPIICLFCQFPVFLSDSPDLAGRLACPEEHFPFSSSFCVELGGREGGERGREGRGGVRWSNLIWPMAQVSELLTGSIQT